MLSHEPFHLICWVALGVHIAATYFVKSIPTTASYLVYDIMGISNFIRLRISRKIIPKMLVSAIVTYWKLSFWRLQCLGMAYNVLKTESIVVYKVLFTYFLHWNSVGFFPALRKKVRESTGKNNIVVTCFIYSER